MGYTETMKQPKISTVGAVFRQIREARGYSYREMSKALGLDSHSWVKYNEDDKTDKPIAYFELLNKKIHLTAVEKDLIKQSIINALKEQLDEI
jgi:transcriptional regulator with XRE-family HTH domain